ncbi:relaxase/mobilization nuclease domain-containing protein [Limosilactobacillus fermentum]|uniref:relaxase/mobilization nuclease domain-containing protein n=1 Tax=Limosilactobacillus fermentum TaxID=1613 RepID=UPI001C0C9123|nr:relaxase/mobilization nuclease domain-containing protein [Limosilactobacillus fermentum]MDF9443584.1 relaxase/mobilization nuclease domain-containing protein [Limosilactobacillus mucosae]QWS01928.1 relaxase/mobilization nuclease domain-containing protein [Limosilactobacillus fermentum]
MATIKMNRAKSAAAAISYALGKNRLKQDTKDWLIEHGCPSESLKNNDRAVVRSGINVSPTHAKVQMKVVRNHANGDTVKNQAIRIIQSFSPDDLDITKPENWQKCNDIGYEFARRAFGGSKFDDTDYPPYQIAIYTHVDGKGHKLHNHIIINKTNLDDNKQWHVENLNDEWLSFRDINDEVCREFGLKIPQERSKQVKKTISERELELKGQYVWKNDLRSRIDQALDEIQKNNISLEEALKSREVDLRRRGQNGISFAFVDDEGKKRISRGQRLGTKYERKTIDDYEQGIQQQRQQQQADEPRNEPDSRGVHAIARRQAIQSVRDHQQHLERSLSEARSRADRIRKRKQAVAKLIKAIQRAIDRSLAIIKQLKANQGLLHERIRQSNANRGRKFGTVINGQWQVLSEHDVISRALNIIQQKYESDQAMETVVDYLRNQNSNSPEKRLNMAIKILENKEHLKLQEIDKSSSVTPPKPFIKKKAKER